jgi:hypothetical protein
LRAYVDHPEARNALLATGVAGGYTAATCGVAFAIHIGLEHFRLRHSPRRTALHASVAVALGAFALAAAANIHARTAGTGNHGLLALALVIWPILTGVPAFLAAFAAAAGLDLAAMKLTAKDLAPGGRAAAQWDDIAKGLLERALKGMEIAR